MTPSPAHVLMQYLRDLGLVSAPGKPPPDDWASTFGSMPTEPGNVVTFMNTGSRHQGRTHRGPRIDHPKFQILLRANDEVLGWDKGQAIEAALDAVGVPTSSGGAGRSIPVVVGGDEYALNAVHVLVPVTPVGEDADTRRQLYSINGLVELLRLTPDNYTRVFPLLLNYDYGTFSGGGLFSPPYYG